MKARSTPRLQDDRHKPVKVNTSSSRTLDEASEECASKLFQLHRECLPAIHFIQSADHQQSLKLDEAKDEALRRQQELEVRPGKAKGTKRRDVGLCEVRHRQLLQAALRDEPMREAPSKAAHRQQEI
jgi:hypothetical protein